MRPVMQVVDILSDEQQVITELSPQFRQGVVRGIGLDICQLAAALIIEILHQGRIGGKAFRCRDLLDRMTAPQPVRGAKGRHARFGGNAGAGQDDDIAHGRTDYLPISTAPSRRESLPPS